ncbi:sensor histidine kinase [Cryptosporangium sp. NPDC051539]|uniref:sensor histidine kinase n=1 Tax=Cryptosporangium sp. NPDC051539 TaxID=3363962 RepID=UPI00378DA268
MWTRLLFGAVCGAGVVLTAVAIRVSWGGAYWVPGAVSGVLVTACALARHRRLVPASVAALVVAGAATGAGAVFGWPDEPSPVAALALAVLIATSVRGSGGGGGQAGAGRFVGVPVAAGGIAVAVASMAVSGLAPVPVGNAVLAVAAVAAGLGARVVDERRRAARDLVRREERLELARELHDVVAHHVTGIVVQAQAARLAARRDTALAPLGAPLAGIESAGTEALAAMRRVVGVLRDTGDAAPRTAEELPALLDRFAGRGGPVLHRDVTLGEWPPEVTSTVYRVVQEALTNVSRHAPSAGSVSVIVAEARDGLTVEVTDDAPPPGRAGRSGYGLIGMRERVESLGGTLRAGPRDGRGWSVRAELPR